jgi:hypothetical protein
MNIKDILVEKYGYNEQQANITVNSINKITGKPLEIFNNFLKTGFEDDNTDFYGHSVKSLKEKFKMNFFAAILTLDWINRSPEEAVKALSKGIK